MASYFNLNIYNINETGKLGKRKVKKNAKCLYFIQDNARLLPQYYAVSEMEEKTPVCNLRFSIL